MDRLSRVFALAFVGLLIAQSALLAGSITYKQGVISQNQTWSDTVILLSDVRISKGVRVTLKPGTTVVFNDQDLSNLGENPDRVELIVDGRLIRPPANMVKLTRASDQPIAALVNRNIPTHSISVGVSPVSTDPLVEAWRGYKHVYSIGWILVYSMYLIL